MPLPLKTLRVLPNPWTLIHHEKGPQGVCQRDNAGRSGVVRFVGDVERKVVDLPRENARDEQRSVIQFSYPTLDRSLTKGTPEEVPATSGYYRKALADGDLIPGDAATARAIPCRFASLTEAKAAGVAVFEADHGEGAWDELEELLAGESEQNVTIGVKP